MNKDVSLAPSQNTAQIALAESILGKIVQEPKTRWNPSSLVANGLAAIEAACSVIFSDDLLAFAQTSLNETAISTIDDMVTSSGVYSSPMMLNVKAVSASTRSRQLDFSPHGVSYDILPTVDDVPTYNLVNAGDALLEVLAPQPQTFSATSLIGKIDSFFQDREVPLKYLGILDQESGRVLVWELRQGATAAQTLLEMETNLSEFVLLAKFDLEVPDPTAPATPSAVIPWG